jgi:tetratricopeptide (TPR) repeat protein
MKATSIFLCVLTVAVTGFSTPATAPLPVASLQEPATFENEKPEAISLLGKPLYRPKLSAETKKRLEANLAKARAEYEADPDNPETLIWLGRRTAYLWRYREAIEIYSHGIEQHPNNAKLYRHRGHRYISIRKFDQAIADLERAAALIEGVPDEIEPDGAPNKFNIPRSTLNSNIWYHLGLAYYLKGDYDNALRAYREGMKFSTVNDDMFTATSYWLYLTYRRLGKTAEAAKVLEPIREEMDILESFAYHDLLLMFKGVKTPESLLGAEAEDDLNLATHGYGIAMWYQLNGQEKQARRILEKIIDGNYWAAFGYIAAEAELKRLLEKG